MTLFEEQAQRFGDKAALCDPAAGENDLAYTVLKRSISELSYNYTEGAELSNTICAVIRS